MRVSKLLLAQVGLVWSKTDVHFNHDHPSSELAQLEKWNALAHKFFQNHAEDFLPKFNQKWFGKNGNDGRLNREVTKLYKAYDRKCTAKHLDPNVSILSEDELSERKRRSSEEGEHRHHNPGHRIMHIVSNMSKWADVYLSKCSNQAKIVDRYHRFMARFESELMKNPKFQKEFENDAVARSDERNGQRCGTIYSQFGLHGWSKTLYDGQGINDLGDTEFDGDELMSMAPVNGCYIRAYQHANKEGYSSVCDNPNGCDLGKSVSFGSLLENQATSVYCYCNQPSTYPP